MIIMENKWSESVRRGEFIRDLESYGLSRKEYLKFERSFKSMCKNTPSGEVYASRNLSSPENPELSGKLVSLKREKDGKINAKIIGAGRLPTYPLTLTLKQAEDMVMEQVNEILKRCIIEEYVLLGEGKSGFGYLDNDHLNLGIGSPGGSLGVFPNLGKIVITGHDTYAEAELYTPPFSTTPDKIFSIPYHSKREEKLRL